MAEPLDDKQLLYLQDMLGACLGTFGQGQTRISDEDLRTLYNLVTQFRGAQRLERERFAKWLREAAKFRNKKACNTEDKYASIEEAAIAYAYTKIAHQLEENFLPEIPLE